MSVNNLAVCPQCYRHAYMAGTRSESSVILPDQLQLHICSVFVLLIERNHLVACVITNFCCHMLNRGIKRRKYF